MNYTNNTRRDGQVTEEYSLGLTSNYAIRKNAPEEVRLVNLTSSSDQQEWISFRYSTIPQVNTLAKVSYPAPVRDGVQYAVQIDELVRETLADGTNVDHPIVMYLTIRHELSGAISDSVLQETFERLLSTLRYEASNAYRFKQLQLGGLVPTAD